MKGCCHIDPYCGGGNIGLVAEGPLSQGSNRVSDVSGSEGKVGEGAVAAVKCGDGIEKSSDIEDGD